MGAIELVLPARTKSSIKYRHQKAKSAFWGVEAMWFRRRWIKLWAK
jgi:hypothetical protein